MTLNDIEAVQRAASLARYLNREETQSYQDLINSMTPQELGDATVVLAKMFLQTIPEDHRERVITEVLNICLANLLANSMETNGGSK